jgi:hypothetical protein
VSKGRGIFGALRDTVLAFNLKELGIIIFVSLELPDESPVSKKNSKLSQPETVSTAAPLAKSARHKLKLGLWRRQLPSRYGIGEGTGLMRAIAERLVGGVPTTTEPNGGASGQAKGLTFGIQDLKIAFHAQGSVVIDSNFRGRHFFSLVKQSMPTVLPSAKHK